jgi:lactate dehydrogenase-like 2-hydroxyacid dehydrogenase
MDPTAAPVVLLSGHALGAFEKRLHEEGWRTVGPGEVAEADRGEVRALAHASILPLRQADLESMPNLGLIHCMGAGYETVDVPWCRARGIEVTNAGDANAELVADYALGMLLAAWRNVAVGDRMIREGRWTQVAPREARGPGLKGRRLGIVGFGHIGVACAKRAEPFGLDISWWGPRPKPEARWPRIESLLELAAWSDILLVACRANAENRGLISREIIEAVGPGGMVLNIARGSVVDEDALILALKDGRLGRAALDVFWEEPSPAARWADVPNTLLTPHAAGLASDPSTMIYDRAVENLRLFFAGRPVATPVPSSA